MSAVHGGLPGAALHAQSDSRTATGAQAHGKALAKPSVVAFVARGTFAGSGAVIAVPAFRLGRAPTGARAGRLAGSARAFSAAGRSRFGGCGRRRRGCGAGGRGRTAGGRGEGGLSGRRARREWGVAPADRAQGSPCTRSGFGRMRRKAAGGRNGFGGQADVLAGELTRGPRDARSERDPGHSRKDPQNALAAHGTHASGGMVKPWQGPRCWERVPLMTPGSAVRRSQRHRPRLGSRASHRRPTPAQAHVRSTDPGRCRPGHRDRRCRGESARRWRPPRRL